MTESTAFAGVVLAGVAALGWAAQYVFIRIGTQDGTVSDAMLVSLCSNVAIIVPLALVVHRSSYTLTWLSVLAFAGGGIAGSLLSRVFQFKSTELIGASRTAPVVSASALIAALLAVAFLEETLTAVHLLGIVLIVGAVAVISWETASDPENTASLDEAGKALLLPLLAAVALGIEPILLVIGLGEGTPTLVGLAIMSTSATIGFVAYQSVTGRFSPRAAFTSSELVWYLGAGLAGTVALLGYFAALAVSQVVIVVPLMQTAPLLVVVLSIAFLPRHLEYVTWRLGGSAILVVVGATIVSLSG